MSIKLKIIMAAVALVAASGAAIFFIIERGSDDDMRGRIPIYFFNAAQGQMEAEFRDMPQGSPDIRIDAALRYFTSAPDSNALKMAWPVGFEFTELVADIFLEEIVREVSAENYVYEQILITEFTDMYDEISPIDAAVFRSAFTLTMVGLPYIDGVMFRTYDDEWVEYAETIANNPFISSARRTVEEFTLFFVDESGEGLITATYLENDVDLLRRIQIAIELLIQGQNEPGIMPLIPAETRVRPIIIEMDALGIYVDFSSEFHRNFMGTSAQAHMMLQSITHTVLENHRGTHTRVFFLIDSERWDDFHGVSDFNLGFTMDESFLLGYEPQPEIYEEE
ncbi:MAG: GerMN domain-containing protein [Defluviitaleaceae bacterium]|nr:GerMN domain-containing protein [Defluviitaleaceae bacterium]